MSNNNKETKSTVSAVNVAQSRQGIFINNYIFKAKSEIEVIKVPKCTYSNDVKEKSKYYLCQCSPEEFFPICEGCAKKCHLHHNPTLELEGVYICQCGKNNHLLTKANEELFHEKKMKNLNKCFFTKFMEITHPKTF